VLRNAYKLSTGKSIKISDDAVIAEVKEMDKVITIVMAGGAGERLQPLTRERSKAAVPFGGKYRLIDFTLSNCINSGLRRIYVLTQYRSGSLHRHIQDGWGISSSRLGDFIYCIPAQQKLGTEWYRGTADAVRQNLNLVTKNDIEDVLILSGDHIYKMNYFQLIAYHRMKKASATIAAIRTSKEQAAGRLGVLEIGHDNRLIGFEEKPVQPKTIYEAPDYALASMGIYIFSISTLLEELQGEDDDFGTHIIPGMIGKYNNLFVYDYEKENKIKDFVIQVNMGKREKIIEDRTHDSSYWKDVGTIDSYYEASMDLVGIIPSFNLYGEQWPIRTFQRQLPPSKFILNGKAFDSIVSNGCIISGGQLWRSILSPRVTVEKDASIEESVIFDDVIIEPATRIRRAIIDKEVKIRTGVSIGYDLEKDIRRGCTVLDSNIVIVPKGTEIMPV
jgi:glucose-1-phosphate adenylyltransferase